MKIVITHTSFILYWIPRLKALSKKLREHGHELVVVEVTSTGAVSNFGGAQIPVDMDSNWIRLFDDAQVTTITAAKMSSALWDVLNTVHPDVIMASALAFPTGATSVRWCRTHRRGVVIMDDARLADVPRSRLVNWVKRRIYYNVDAMFVPAASHRISFESWGIPCEKIFYGVNVIDNKWFEEKVASLSNQGDLRSYHRLPKRYFLGLGRQVSKKNWHMLIQAYDSYRRAHSESPWELVLVGDGPERHKLEKLVAEQNIQGVHFYPFCTQEEACIYYKFAKCLILPSLYGETWGLVVNEAMACGLPVLVSKACGCSESLVREGQNGWTFSPKNQTEIVESLFRMASLNANELDAMGQESRKIIGQWSLDRFATSALSAIESCKGVSRGFYAVGDRALLSFWKGRYRSS
jgi:glycosyltransferase involved in cell wall biosynthesis